MPTYCLIVARHVFGNKLWLDFVFFAVWNSEDVEHSSGEALIAFVIFSICLGIFFLLISIYGIEMAKGRGNRHQVKKSSTVVLVMSMLLMLTVVLLLLLGLGVFSLPIGYDDDESPIGDHIKLKRLTLETWAFNSVVLWLCFFGCGDFEILYWRWYFVFLYFCDSERSKGEGVAVRGERWAEALSWEPRAFVYHSFLVSFDFVLYICQCHLGFGVVTCWLRWVWCDFLMHCLYRN